MKSRWKAEMAFIALIAFIAFIALIALIAFITFVSSDWLKEQSFHRGTRSLARNE